MLEFETLQYVKPSSCIEFKEEGCIYNKIMLVLFFHEKYDCVSLHRKSKLSFEITLTDALGP